MGKQWTPPNSDTIVDDKSWTPPSSDEEVKKKVSSDKSSNGSSGGLMPVKLTKTAPTTPQSFTQTNGSVRKDKSWENLGDFVPNTILGGLQKDAGQAAKFIGDNFAFSDNNPLSRLGARLEGSGKEKQAKAAKLGLPDTVTGTIASEATKFGPDLLELALTPELDVAKLGKLSEVLGKTGTKIAQVATGKFPTLMATKGLTSGYVDAKDKGASDYDATKQALIKSAGEYGKGALFEGAGKIAGKASDIGKKLMEDNGWMADGKIVSGAQKAILNSTAQAAAFSAVPFITNAVQGKSTSIKELKDNAIFGGVLGLFHGSGEKEGEHTAADGASAQIAERAPIIDLHNFANADIDAIKEVHEMPENAADLKIKSAVGAEQAFKAETPEEKQQAIVQSSTDGKAASVKTVTDAILKDKDAVIDAIPEDLPNRQELVDKINEVHKSLDPVEKEKTNLSGQIQQLDEQLKKEPADPIESAEQELLKGKRTELNNQLKSIIQKQQEHETSKTSTNNAKEKESPESVAERPEDSSEKGDGQGNGEQEEKAGNVKSGGDEPPVTNKSDEQGVGGTETANADEKQPNKAESKSDTGETVIEPTIGQETKSAKEKEEPIDATKTGSVAESGEPKHKGTTQGENVSENGKQVREEKSGQTGSSDSADGGEEKEKITGIKKAISDNTRVQKKLPNVELTKLGKDAEVLQRGRKSIESGKVEPAEVVSRVVHGNGIYTPEEAEAMQYYSHQLSKQAVNLIKHLSEAGDNEELKSVVNQNLQQLMDATDQKTQADRISSRSWSNLGNIMQIEADESFNPTNVRSVIKENYGGHIPKEVEERLSKAEADRDEAIADLKKAIDMQIKNGGEQMVEKMRKKTGIIKQSKEELKTEADQLIKDLKKALKVDFSKMNSGLPIPTETLEVLGKLAVNYFKQGVKDFEGIVNRIHNDIKDESDVDKQQLREYLSTYDPLREESKQNRLKKLGDKERSIEKQLSTGEIRDYSRKPEISFKKDNEVIRAEQRVSNAEYKIKQERRKSYDNTSNKYQRALNWIARWERRAVLASPLILEKLASAATIGGAINRIPKQLIGGAYSAIFKDLAEKATIEGGLNMDAEIKFWKEFSDPKKFVKAAIEILKTGASDLTKKYSDKALEHHMGIDALMDLHSIIKDPPKRATFEASLKYAYNWAAKNGLDYTDPLIQKSLENAAYKRAEYEIFQENNGLARRINNFINSERKQNDEEATKRFLVKFLLPVQTVPLNIGKRIVSSITGAPKGLYEVYKAYKGGIDNLTPDQADVILRQLKNGSIGLAYYTLGMYAGPKILGGVWNKDAKEGSKSLPNRLGFNEMKVGSFSIDKRIQHAMPLYLMQLGATTARVYNHYMDVPTDDPKYQTMLKSLAHSMAATAGAEVEEIPTINEPVHAVQALSDPYERKKFGEDVKRRLGFGVLKDLGISKEEKETALNKKIATITDSHGDKQKLSPELSEKRKEIYNNYLSDNPNDWPSNHQNKQKWTHYFNQDWKSDKSRQKKDDAEIKYLKTINRSAEYIANKMSDKKQEALDKYLQQQALDWSEGDIEKIERNKPTFTIKKK